MRDISSSSFDPRAWNLFTGAVLVTACAPGSVTGATEATATSEESTATSEESTATSEESTESTEESTSDAEGTDTEGTDTGDTTGTETGYAPECITDDDCYYPTVHCFYGMCVECEDDWDCNYQSGYECFNNVCMEGDNCYSFGSQYYFTNCGQYEFCAYSLYGGNCHTAAEPPPPDCNTDVMGIPTVLDPGAPPLALSFVDVDDDGLDELAVATATQLLVYELGIPDPTVSDRAMPSNVVQAMVSGQFNGQTGEDLMLLVDTDVHGYFSDGVSAFVNPSTLPSPIDMPLGLLADDFDGQAPEDLWVWGPSGARLYLGGIDLSVDVLYGGTNGAAAFEYTSLHAGLLLGVGTAYARGDLSLFDLAGGPLANTWGFLDSVAAVSAPDEGRFVGAAYHTANWSTIRFRDADTLAQTQAHVHAGHLLLLAGDFDGDQSQEVLAVGDAVELILDVFDAPCIETLELGIQPAAILPAVGDHDGDGDDEFAVISGAGKVIIVDVE